MGAALPGARAPYRLPLQRVGVQYMSAEWIHLAPEAGVRCGAGGMKLCRRLRRRPGARGNSGARPGVLLNWFAGEWVEAGARWRRLDREPLPRHRVKAHWRFQIKRKQKGTKIVRVPWFLD